MPSALACEVDISGTQKAKELQALREKLHAEAEKKRLVALDRFAAPAGVPQDQEQGQTILLVVPAAPHAAHVAAPIEALAVEASAVGPVVAVGPIDASAAMQDVQDPPAELKTKPKASAFKIGQGDIVLAQCLARL